MAPNLDDLFDELHRGKVYECALRDPRWHLDGLHSAGTIYIDPRPAMLETLVHELIHRRHPRLGERAVTRIARRLTAEMDEPMKRKWWTEYQRVRKRARPVDVEE